MTTVHSVHQQTNTETASPHPNNKPTPKQQTDTETSNPHANNKPTPNQRASILLDQTTTMNEITITHHPSELLHQVAMAINWRHPEISVTVPSVTTWKTALRAIDSALGEVDEPMMVLYNAAQNPTNRFSAKWLCKVISSLSKTSIQRDTEAVQRGCNVESPFLPPVRLHSPHEHHGETLPVVKGRVELKGIDHVQGDPTEVLQQVAMICDTGTHQTIITEDLLSESFRQFLKDSRHDDYRLENGLRLQMDSVISLSNVPLDISAIVMVVLKSVMPNEHIGILFGQQQCINSISYRSSPRRILQAKGEDIKEEMWGDIVVDGFVDFDDKLHSF